MIRNQRQYRITKAQAEKLGAALKSFVGESTSRRTTDKHLVKAQADALNSQIQSLLDELREYENFNVTRQLSINQ